MVRGHGCLLAAVASTAKMSECKLCTVVPVKPSNMALVKYGSSHSSYLFMRCYSSEAGPKEF
eukprot:scaffold202058_cov18-Tisochrysis_lutea.AAC.1